MKVFKILQTPIFIVVSNTHLVERWVKDSNECTYSGKDPHFASLIGMCRSTTVFEYKSESLKQAHCRVLKGNQFVTSGKVDERICKKTGEVEKKRQQ